MKLILLISALVQGSQRPDTAPRRLDPIVVTAERSGAGLSSSVAAVTRISGAALARIPRATLADVLRLAPGFTLVDFDGLGFDPQVMVRGFYGGGEAEYVVVQIDGRPVNQVQTGVVAWDVLPPLASIEAVEIVRGGAGALYGDAAIGGVINVITRGGLGAAGRPVLRWDAGAGSSGLGRAAADAQIGRRETAVGLSAGLDRTDGYRDHAGRTAIRAAVTAKLVESASGHLAVGLRGHSREFEEPGALLESLLATDRRGSDPLFRFDRTTDRNGGGTIDGRVKLGRSTLDAAGTFEARSIDAIRTLALAPGFGDTKERRAETTRAALSAQLTTADSPLPGTDGLVLGTEVSRGSLDSRYFKYAGGTREEYAASSGGRGGLDTRASSVRTSAAGYVQYIVQPSEAVRVSLGGRFDLLHDTFTPSVPAGQSRRSADHHAFSPKLGANLRYADGGAGTGHLYASVSRSFKAPTLDQMYDLRNIPVPFPPFEVRTSNPDLRPQHGTMLEAGLYHGGPVSGSARATASLSVYQIDMKNELDFDVNTFRYVNIGQSRHRGLEAGANLDGARASGFATYALQSARSRSGANLGNRLKAIPAHSITAGVSVRPPIRREPVEASVLLIHARGIYLDDQNSRTLPDYSRVDARVSLRLRGMSLHVEMRNLLGARYSTSGFLDPSGSGEAYLYPAAGRTLEVGVRGGW
jgi:iron complex outermembrane receptor protein